MPQAGCLMPSIDGYPNTLSWRRRRRRYKPTPTTSNNINPVDVWMNYLNSHPLFDNLKGYTSYSTQLGTNGEYEDVPTKFSKRTKSSEYLRFHHKKSGFGCIIHIEPYPQLTNRVFLKCLYVQDEYSNLGIATDCMKELLVITDNVDELAFAGKAYKGKKLVGKYCVLSLFPNAFNVTDWDYEDSNNVDWANKDTAGINIVDNRLGDLGPDKTRMTDQQLKQYYEKHGFVTCEYLDYHYYFSEDHDCIIRGKVLSEYSYQIGRHTMIYPAKNLKYFNIPENPGDRPSIMI